MKVRLDYVTNSSATGYVVCVPRSFDPTAEEIINIFKDTPYLSMDEYDEDELDELVLGVTQSLEELHRGNEVFQYETAGEVFYLLSGILHKFTLGEYDIHSDGNGMIMPITPKKIEEIFLEIHEINLKEVIEGGENVTTEIKQK